MNRKTNRQRIDAKAIDGVDRSFFLWLLASLAAATAISALIALWAAAANSSILG
ncbi:MAG: hypothetical protein AB7F09_02090 [Parvibaculaceae bacterium]